MIYHAYPLASELDRFSHLIKNYSHNVSMGAHDFAEKIRWMMFKKVVIAVNLPLISKTTLWKTIKWLKRLDMLHNLFFVGEITIKCFNILAEGVAFLGENQELLSRLYSHNPEMAEKLLLLGAQSLAEIGDAELKAGGVVVQNGSRLVWDMLSLQYTPARTLESFNDMLVALKQNNMEAVELHYESMMSDLRRYVRVE